MREINFIRFFPREIAEIIVRPMELLDEKLFDFPPLPS